MFTSSFLGTILDNNILASFTVLCPINNCLFVILVQLKFYLTEQVGSITNQNLMIPMKSITAIKVQSIIQILLSQTSTFRTHPLSHLLSWLPSYLHISQPYKVVETLKNSTA